MPDIKDSIVTASEVASFYKHYPGFWFLLEVKEMKAGKVEIMRVVNFDNNKEVLREYLLEELSDSDSKYIFIFADPDGKCDIK